jgi:anti-sigma regulatory factor (Ser/Thr protein kinase)
MTSGAFATKTLAADARQLRVVSAWWHDWARSAGLSDDARDRGELCLNEAVGNIIEHGAAGTPQSVDLIVELHARLVSVTVIDSGAPFNPLEHQPADRGTSLETTPDRGLGILMMRTFAESLAYRRNHNQNVLTFTFSR